VARDQQVIHFRCAEPPTANPDKYADELLDARHRFSFSRHSPLVTVSPLFIFSPLVTRHCFCGEGLRWPSAGFRREPVAFFRRPFAFPGVCHPEPSCGFFDERIGTSCVFRHSGTPWEERQRLLVRK